MDSQSTGRRMFELVEPIAVIAYQAPEPDLLQL